MRSAYTIPWNTCTVASSEAEANSGYERWKAVPRTAYWWYRRERYGLELRSRSNQLQGEEVPRQGSRVKFLRKHVTGPKVCACV